MRLANGLQLGAYEIRDLLGAGGMGEVYRARDHRLRRDVAIKVLPPALAADPARRQRFQQEALAAGALNHANVVTVHDVGSEGDIYYLVAECLEGETLRRRIEARTITTRKAIEFAVQISRGLAAAHARGIVHRDVKPENLFVCEGETVKILDFGLAKLREPESSSSTASLLTAAGTVVGTAAYMSPEQVRGLAVDARSDIFALGVVLYEMLTGSRPFDGATIVEVQTAILREDPPPLTSVQPGVSAALDHLVRRCLEKRPEDRFDSAKDLALALEAAGLATVAPPSADVGRTRRLPRWAAVASAGLLLVLAATAALAVSTWLRPSAVPPLYTQLTFRRGTITGGRFTLDGGTIVYSAAWDGGPSRVYSTRVGSPESRDLGIEGSIWDASPSGDLAIRLGPFRPGGGPAVLGQASVSSTAIRQRATDVTAAAWDRDGRELAVARLVRDRAVVEYPIGHEFARPAGQVSALTFLPDGRIAVFERLPDTAERPFAISLLDDHGGRRVLSAGWSDGTGPLVWSAASQEIFFPGYAGAGDMTLNAVSTSGPTPRVVASIPGDLLLNDLDRRGRILLTRNVGRGGVLARGPGETQERNVSWLDFSSSVDLSADGQRLLLADIGGEFGATGGIGIRPMNGGDVVPYGKGSPLALSPDQQHVLALPSRDSADRLVVVPVGPGSRRELRHPSLRRIFDAAWLADSRRVIVSAGEDPQKTRLFFWDPDRNVAPLPLTPEGEFLRIAVAPDDRRVAVAREGAPLTLYSLADGATQPIPGARPGDQPLRWSADGRELFVRRRASGTVGFIDRLDVATGGRSLCQELRPGDTAGLIGIQNFVITPDGSSYAYTFSSATGTLYLAEGLK